MSVNNFSVGNHAPIFKCAAFFFFFFRKYFGSTTDLCICKFPLRKKNRSTVFQLNVESDDLSLDLIRADIRYRDNITVVPDGKNGFIVIS